MTKDVFYHIDFLAPSGNGQNTLACMRASALDKVKFVAQRRANEEGDCRMSSLLPQVLSTCLYIVQVGVGEVG